MEARKEAQERAQSIAMASAVSPDALRNMPRDPSVLEFDPADLARERERELKAQVYDFSFFANYFLSICFLVV